MAAYTTPQAIAAYLGVTFTSEQEAQAQIVADAVTTWIDRYTGRSWQAATPIVGEVRPVVVPGPADMYGAVARVHLRYAPAVSVAAVGVRASAPNDEPTPLDPSSYELVDPAAGVLLLPGFGYGYLATWSGVAALAVVDYAYDDGAPADISYAATLIAAGQMATAMSAQAASGLVAAHPELAGLKSLSVGQNDISVTLADASARAGAGSSSGSAFGARGSAVAAILDTYRRVVIA